MEKEELNIKNGLILKGFRKQNKLSQQQMGDLIHRDHRSVSAYELGSRPIPKTIINMLNNKYKLKLKYIENTPRKTIIKNKQEQETKKLNVVISYLTNLLNYLKK